jgi:hypothetical protein
MNVVRFDESGQPLFTPEQAMRIARAAWWVKRYLPHPEDVESPGGARNLREFNRACYDMPPLSDRDSP